MSKKQIAIIILLVLGLIILAVGVYLLFMRHPTTTQVIDQPSFPTGTTTPNTDQTNPNQQTDGGQVTTTPSAIPTLNRLSLAPIAGAGIYYTKIGTTTITNIHYTDRAVGHTYAIGADATNRNRITNTTINGIQEALWSDLSVLFRRVTNVDRLQTQVGILSTSTSNAVTIRTSVIPSAMSTVTLSPKKDKLFFITPDTDNNGIAVIATSNGSSPKQLLTVPLSEWTASWPNENIVTLTTKPSAGFPGYLYFLNIKNVTLNKVLGDISGLTTLTSSSTNQVLYTETTTNAPISRIYDLVKKAVAPLTIGTFSEKCTWSSTKTTIVYCAIPTSIPSGNYPDDWYQGKILFTDNIYAVDTANQITTLLYVLPVDEAIDATDLMVDNSDHYLFFTNKKNYSLWSLNLVGLPQ